MTAKGGCEPRTIGKEKAMTSIFVNFPVNDLERSKEFYTALGADINPLFTDDNAACIVWDEKVYFMALTKEYFATFTTSSRWTR